MRKRHFRLGRPSLDALAELLTAGGYQLFGPTLRNHAIQWTPIQSLEDLPVGWTADSNPASYRIRPGPTDALFQYWTGPDSLKKILHPPRARLLHTERENDSFRILEDQPIPEKRAFFGVRACDLAAVAALDRVLLEDRFTDPLYRANRENALFIAVHCASSAPTCFCASTGTGPQALAHFDIALHERLSDTGPPEYFAEAGSPAGANLLDQLAAPAAPPEWARELAQACRDAAAAQTRRVDLSDAPAVIERNFENPYWDTIARRCLACGNCTSSCPTCFCLNFEDSSSLDLHSAERHRVWDSCFTQNFTYIHGGSIRLSTRSRYRHWLGHKLARWQQQFGLPGCVGCGRCITWCPAGIDITEEFQALQSPAARGV